MQNLSYEEVVNIIEKKRRFGNLTGAEITKVLLEQLGHPEKEMHIIHIAGTNGKGSVSAFLCSILQEAGKRVGMFTSPHLVDFRERIQLNGSMISKEDTLRLGKMLLEEKFPVSPTMFDYCLAMALLYFKEQGCDVAVIETGLGGRCDSTNALGIPDVSVITKIGFDHMAILGDTLAEIAGEKAGIIKTGSRLVLESQEQEAGEVLRHAAEAAKVRDVTWVERENIIIEGYREGRQYFSYGKYKHLCMRMLGVHQYENAAAAILAAEAYLSGKIPEASLQRAVSCGIEKTFWKGRMEVLWKNPFFMVDGAHNSNGVEALGKSLAALFPGEKFHFIMGVLADKDYELMIEALLPLAMDFKTVTVESSRALQGEELAACIRKKGIKAESYQLLEDVLPDFSKKQEEKTIAFGSLYFIGEIEAYMQKLI